MPLARLIINDLAFAKLVQTFAPQNKLLRTWPLPGGISARMDVVEMEGPDGGIEWVVVRRPGGKTLARNPQAAEHEFRTLQIARSMGLAARRLSTIPYWDLSAALRLIRLAGADLDGWAAFFHPYGRMDITGGSLKASIHAFISQAFERLPGRR